MENLIFSVHLSSLIRQVDTGRQPHWSTLAAHLLRTDLTKLGHLAEEALVANLQSGLGVVFGNVQKG